jgi:hypothetical protein
LSYRLHFKIPDQPKKSRIHQKGTSIFDSWDSDNSGIWCIFGGYVFTYTLYIHIYRHILNIVCIYIYMLLLYIHWHVTSAFSDFRLFIIQVFMVHCTLHACMYTYTYIYLFMQHIYSIYIHWCIWIQKVYIHAQVNRYNYYCY